MGAGGNPQGRNADKANNRLTANLAFPTFDLRYTLEMAAEPGGVRVSINLDKPLPEKLAGQAAFNLEFLALDLHGQDIPGGWNESRHLPANA